MDLTRSELGVGAASIFTGFLSVDSKSSSLHWAPKVRGGRTLHLLYVVCELVSLQFLHPHSRRAPPRPVLLVLKRTERDRVQGLRTATLARHLIGCDLR